MPTTTVTGMAIWRLWTYQDCNRDCQRYSQTSLRGEANLEGVPPTPGFTRTRVAHPTVAWKRHLSTPTVSLAKAGGTHRMGSHR